MDRSPTDYGYGGGSISGDGHWIVYGWRSYGDCVRNLADRQTAQENPYWLEPQVVYEDYGALYEGVDD